mmetsp:Transcript_36982/g.66540  ORF Transcript_36982/g.66540 Transcript_36982/m.66540 type:complete len:121 (-) Transcript_36982:276-638(-)
MVMKLFFTVALIAVLTSLQDIHVANGFTLTAPLSPARFGGAASSITKSPGSTSATGIMTPASTSARRPVTFLSMTDESDERDATRRKQQLGAAAVLLFGVLYDFFITHHGVGFWDPNYVV